MIIAFCGRKGSGKTELARQLFKYGFVKKSFADELKVIVSQLYGWTIDELCDPTVKEQPLDTPVYWNQEKANILLEIIKNNYSFSYQNGKEINSKDTLIHSRRQALQFIGTEVLRDYDYDFHVKATKNSLHKNINYVFDDVRFKNEDDALKSRGAIRIFVLRPHYEYHSNHASEISLDYKKFDLVIVNNSNKYVFVKKFNSFIDDFLNLPEIKCRHNTFAFHNITAKTAYWVGVFSVIGKVYKSSEYNCYLTFRSGNKKLLNKFQKYLGSDHKLTNWHDETYGFNLRCPYLTEDLKRWDMTPLGNSEKPDCITTEEMLKWWNKGRAIAGEKNAIH